MARHNTRSPQQGTIFNTSGQHFLSWTWGTIAVVLRRTLDNSMAYFANQSDRFSASYDASQLATLWIGASAVESKMATTVTVAKGWVVHVTTKATGTVAPRGHIYQWSTNTWTHQDYGTALADAATGTGNVTYGRAHSGAYFDGDFAAIMAINRQAMTDSECERLPAGNWSRWLRNSDDFLVEFRSGRDQPEGGSGAVWTSGRGRMKATSIGNGPNARSAMPDPPGFRFTPATLRGR